MPIFVYKAKQGPDKMVEGSVVAESRASAVSKIERMGYSAVSVRETDADSDAGGPRRGIISRFRVGRREVTLFTRQLSSLIRAGVPILQALATTREQTSNSSFRRIIGDIEKHIRDGGMLSSAMAAHPSQFPDLYVGMVRAGESAGLLDTSLLRLAEAREKEDDTSRKVQAAIAYPALILGVGFITVFVLLTFFLPQITGLFKGQQNLPWPTRVVMGVSDAMSVRGQGVWLLLSAALAFVVFRRLAEIEQGRMLVDRTKLGIPGVGVFLRESDLARFCRTLALLLESGLSVDRALGLSAGTMRNAVLRKEMDTIRQNTVLQGTPFSHGLKRSKYVPGLVANMVAVGEESGKIEESLHEVADFYEKQIDHNVRMTTSLLEPVLILVVGAIVGFIVAAMLLPIFRITTAL